MKNKLVLVVILTTALGAALAQISIYTHLSTGWIGALIIIVWTFYMRQHWDEKRKTTGLEPGAPERVLRLQVVGTSLLFGHLLTAILHLELDLHIGEGNTLAIDSWTMILALLIAGIVFRNDKKIQDERDVIITAKGMKAGYYALIVQIVILLFYLGFSSPKLLKPLTPFVLGNLLVALILFSLLIKILVQLISYSHDTSAIVSLEVKSE
ncbi:MAG: hypothetical protein JKX98_10945 [Alcanivoracaceae bacterium]|nr:hypothetical protein [Alcanivoracaceae bacterium]